MQSNLEHALRYLQALESGADRATLANFFDPAVIQEEFPNRLMPNGARRDLTALLDGNERGKQILRAQRYAVEKAIESNNQVILEVVWTGTLAIPLGTLPIGGEMRARFAVFLEFQDGKIIAQRNYDCFDPW